jgi:hypothetical protein
METTLRRTKKKNYCIARRKRDGAIESELALYERVELAGYANAVDAVENIDPPTALRRQNSTPIIAVALQAHFLIRLSNILQLSGFSSL